MHIITTNENHELGNPDQSSEGDRVINKKSCGGTSKQCRSF